MTSSICNIKTYCFPIHQGDSKSAALAVLTLLDFTGWSFNLVPSLYGMAVLLHAKVTTLQFIFKNGQNLGSDYHFLMKLSGFLNYG